MRVHHGRLSWERVRAEHETQVHIIVYSKLLIKKSFHNYDTKTYDF